MKIIGIYFLVSLQQTTFLYAAEDFVTERVEFGLERLSPFDRRIIDAFDAADKAGVLRFVNHKRMLF